MIQYLTDPIICINSALSLSLLWITAHDVYVSNIRHVISSTSVRPTFTNNTQNYSFKSSLLSWYGNHVLLL